MRRRGASPPPSTLASDDRCVECYRSHESLAVKLDASGVDDCGSAAPSNVLNLTEPPSRAPRVDDEVTALCPCVDEIGMDDGSSCACSGARALSRCRNALLIRRTVLMSITASGAGSASNAALWTQER